MGTAADLYRVQTDFDFRKAWRIMLVVSSVLVIVGVASLATRGLNLSIDFRGGAVWEVPSKTMTTQDATDVLAKFNKEAGAKVQSVTDANGRRIVRVQAEEAKNIKQSETIAAALAEKANATANGGATVKVTDIATNTVGPSWGASITKDAVRALIVFFIVIAAYMSWQLEWRMAVSALIAVVHDVILTVGFYSVFGFEVTPATVISILTILGFSLYDTIVVYDRVQENAARYDRTGRFTYQAIMRKSLNQVLMRSLNTTFVAILPVLAILLIGGVAYGQATMLDFSLALLVGLVAGAYSSIAIASPFVVWLKEREPRYVKIRQRARDRGAEEEADWIRVDAMPVLAGATASGSSARSASGGAAGGASGGAIAVDDDLDDDESASGAATPQRPSPLAAKAAQYQRQAPPRPRKQGKKR
ncbi:MAG: protein translocase subunit SecF [Acidimicrobiales bacterium]